MIQIEKLSFAYNKNKPLFKELTLSLSGGNIYGLLGKNGAGKSTLLKIIAGLLFPKQGTVDVLGFQPRDRFPSFLQEIYLITEECHLPCVTMSGFVQMYSPFYPRFNHNQLNRYIAEFHLPHSQKLSEMSYGQKKKFLLSFGLATDCNVLILDEPTNGLDIPSKSQFRKVVASAITEERSFIISTHQVRDMENLIDPIIILDEGKVVFFEDCLSITQKLAFTKEKKFPEDENLIYTEPCLGGHTVVRENKNNEETHLNLETLFKAVINNKDNIQKLFNH